MFNREKHLGKSKGFNSNGGISINIGRYAENTVAPAITGTTTMGSTLTCSTGTWVGDGNSYSRESSNGITYSYQWKRGVTNIGANQNTYVTVVGDHESSISCVVTGTNSLGNSTAISNVIYTFSYLPVNIVAPAITGNLNVGQVLTCDTGTWTNSPNAYSYQWYKDGQKNATTSTYTITDAANTIKCAVIAGNEAGVSGETGVDSNTVVTIP